MNVLVILLALVLLLALGGFLVWAAMRAQQAEEDVETRVFAYLEEGQEVNIRSIEELELRQPFSERVLYPLARSIGNVLLRFTPQRMLAAAELDLIRAGLRSKMDPAVFLGLRLLLGVVMIALALFVLRFANPDAARRFGLLMVLMFGFLGYYLPFLYVQRRIRQRQRMILKALPDALDLITVGVQAGLSFDGALQQIVDKWENELALEFARVLRDIQLGKPRSEALKDMAERVGLPELTSFVAAIVQAEQLGVNLSNILKVQSDAMRLKRRQRAEEEAHQAPIRMIFPLAFLVMPAMFIILLGPACFIVFKSGVFGAMGG